MKKIILSSLILISLCSVPSVTPTLASEISSDVVENLSPISRAAVVKLWFNGIPPKTYKGKPRINYYKYQGGYIGVYSRI